MSEKDLEKTKRYYEKGFLKREQIDAMYNAGKITEEEYHYILGE